MKDTRMIHALRTTIHSRVEERAKKYASLDASSQNAVCPQRKPKMDRNQSDTVWDRHACLLYVQMSLCLYQVVRSLVQ